MWKQVQKMFSNEEDYSRLNNPDETFTSFFRTPVHLAVMSGDTKFATKILSQKPDLAFKRDSNGFTPLHLASVRTNLPMVKLLLKANPGACIVQDEGGRTPLHLAALKNRVEIMKLLIEEGLPEAIHLKNHRNGETILHFCVKNNTKLKTLKLLTAYLDHAHAPPPFLNSVSINSTDNDGNTILHLATEMGNIKITNYLLLNSRVRIDINVVNNKGLKALNLLPQDKRNDLEFGFYDYHVRHHKNKSETWSENGYHEGLKDRVNALMVVATLIAGIAFQAAMNPPGGVWQDDSKISSSTDPVTFSYYLQHMFGSSVSGGLDSYIDIYLKYTSVDGGGQGRDNSCIKDFVNDLINIWITGYNVLMSKGLILEDFSFTDAVSNYNNSGNSSFPYLMRYAGNPILAYTWPGHYVIYMVTNAVAFFVSLTLISLVICGFMMERSITQVRILVVLMCISIGCIAFGYLSILVAMMPDFYIGLYRVYFVLLIFFGVCCLLGLLRFLVWTAWKIVKLRKVTRHHHIGVINYVKALFFTMGASAAGKLILLIVCYVVFRFAGYAYYGGWSHINSFLF
ncbi:hypothetical protein MKW92_036007 [Papaver armeniacum]|nr:hypothetical protein MKW92_036007 [Papaver armeniacum]